MFRDILDRHFTWLSASVVGILVLSILSLVIYFVTGIEPGTAIEWAVIVLTGGVTLLTAVSSIITIRRWWRSTERSYPTHSSSDSEEDAESESNTISSRLSTPAEGFVRTDEELYDRAKTILDGHFAILEDGEIQLEIEDIPYDCRAMLYVFAARVAYDAGRRDSPLVSNQEIQDEIGGSTASANIFFSKMGDRVDRNFDPDEVLDDWEDDEIKVELNLRYSVDAAKYIRGID